MAERVTDFVKRLGGEVSGFAREKGRELSDKVQEGADMFVSAVDDQAYQTALSLVAKRHSLTTEEAESRLRTFAQG